MGCSKVVLLVVAGCGWFLPVRSQLEGKTLQVMLGQIAALNEYSSAAADGYRLVENGWHTIGAIRQGEWDLHKMYYGSLATVNPVVRAMPEARDIITIAGLLAKRGRTAEASAAASDLSALLTDGHLVMTDGERMRRIIVLDEELRRRLK
jgi:hypothetical protein